MVSVKINYKLFLIVFILLPFYLSANDFSIDDELTTISGQEDIDKLIDLKKEFESQTELAPKERLKYILTLDNLVNYGKGYKDELKKAFELTQKLKEEKNNKFNPYIGLLEGYTLSLMGREASNPIEKISNVKKAINYLDESKLYYSKSTFIPLLCGNIFLALPDFFEQRKKAFETFLFLEKRIDAKISSGVKCNIYFNLAQLYKQKRELDKTVKYWKKAIKVDRDSICANRAKKLIKIFTDEE
jgi:tetratricopeptide (TPR) repeat protein